MQLLILIFSSLPPLLLSPFIINLRQGDSLDAETSAGQHISRFSVPNFRRPTLDEVVGNLGESLDFVEDSLYEDTDDADATSTSETTGIIDINAPEPCVCDDVLDISGVEFEVCLINVLHSQVNILTSWSNASFGSARCFLCEQGMLCSRTTYWYNIVLNSTLQSLHKPCSYSFRGLDS